MICIKHRQLATAWLTVTIFCLLSLANAIAGDKIRDALSALKSGNTESSPKQFQGAATTRKSIITKVSRSSNKAAFVSQRDETGGSC